MKKSAVQGTVSKLQGEKRLLTVAQAAIELGVGKQTILGYLGRSRSEEAPIPFNAWYRLPGGHIRIHGWIIDKILGL
jgi:hypothetical protein